MNVAELDRLLERVTQGNWCAEGNYITSDAMHEMDCVAESHRYDGEHDLQLMSLAPYLARRVIAAEKLVEALNPVIEDLCQDDMPTPHEIDVLYKSLVAYEASK